MLSVPKDSTVFGLTRKTTSNALNKAVIHQCKRNKTTFNCLSKEVLDLWKRKKNAPSLLNKTIIDQWQRDTLLSSSKVGSYSFHRSITQTVKNDINPSDCYKICKCGNAERNLLARNKTNFSLGAQDRILNFATAHKYAILRFREAGKYSSLYNVISGISKGEFKRAYESKIITGCSFCMAAIIALLCVGVKSEEGKPANIETHGKPLGSFSRHIGLYVGHSQQYGNFREELYHIIPSE